MSVSPNPANCSKLEKDVDQALTLYMGPMDSGEAEEMRQLCYSTITKEEANERFSNVGGVARFLYRPRDSEEEDDALNAIDDRQTFALNDLAGILEESMPAALRVKTIWCCATPGTRAENNQ